MSQSKRFSLGLTTFEVLANYIDTKSPLLDINSEPKISQQVVQRHGGKEMMTTEAPYAHPNDRDENGNGNMIKK